jgi:hypothetical protein
MTDPSPSPETGETPKYPGMPGWVKVSGVVVLALIVLLVVAMVASGGQHGPMRHAPSGDPGNQSPLTGAQRA